MCRPRRRNKRRRSRTPIGTIFAPIRLLGELIATVRKPGEIREIHVAVGWFVTLTCFSFLGYSALRIFGIFDEGRPNPKDVEEFFAFGSIALGLGLLAGWYTFFRSPYRTVNLWIFGDGILCERGDRLEARP